MTTTLDYALLLELCPEESWTEFSELSPGMAVSVEVMTGTRRVMEFVLSPVMQHVQESGTER